ncbi:MAG: hypothetical protein PF961_11590 [Planctomycetota bacterium]|jgi:hypothetical protein|nr:hypothetical protein [Planctomycetota bacterium]
MMRCHLITTFALLALASFGVALEAAEPNGLVQWSNGEEDTGDLSFAPGVTLKLHDGSVRHRIEPSQVAELRLRPEKEELLRRWRFLEPGKPAKEEIGEPKPTRTLAADLTLIDGRELSGHLFTTMAILRNEAGKQRVLIPAKQQGDEGTALNALIYPQRMVFAPFTQGHGHKVVVTGHAIALTRPGLARLGINDGTLHAGAATAVFLARIADDAVHVSWPNGDHTALQQRLQNELNQIDDFFDDRRISLAWSASDDTRYSVVMLQRSGVATGSKPWRIEIWRWHHDAIDDRYLIAGRGWLARGLGAPPQIHADPALWNANPICRGETP